MRNSRLFIALVVLAVVIFIAITANLPNGESSSLASPNVQPNASTSGSIVGAAAALEDAIDALAEAEEGDTLVQPSSGQTAPLSSDGHLPLMIRWSNWLPEFGPALVYAREQDLDGMLRLEGPLDKMLMVTSMGELERLMVRANELRAAGVTTVGLNTENGPGMTPAAEMQTLNNPDPQVNFVARAARLATENGFAVLWGPVRRTVDTLSDATVRTMMEAGVRGLAIQEQKFIETQPAQARLQAVNQTRARYLRIAGELGIEDFTFHVQIMQQRCPNLDNCVTFVQLLEEIPVHSIAIWSNGPIPPSFVSAIRSN